MDRFAVLTGIVSVICLFIGFAAGLLTKSNRSWFERGVIGSIGSIGGIVYFLTLYDRSMIKGMVGFSIFEVVMPAVCTIIVAVFLSIMLKKKES